jgi:hypothetical protein
MIRNELNVTHVPDTLLAEMFRQRRAEETNKTIHVGAAMMVVCVLVFVLPFLTQDWKINQW